MGRSAGPCQAARKVRDEHFEAQVTRVHSAHYGAQKVRMLLNREGVPVARCTIERLMRRLDLHGAVRWKLKRTTIFDRGTRLPDDLVQQRFAPPAPDRLRGADITYVSTWSGWVYVAFVLNTYARQIPGWRTGTTMTTRLVLDAIEQASRPKDATATPT